MGKSYVVLIRNPSTGTITALMDGHDFLAAFPSEAAAYDAASSNLLCQNWPHDVVRAP